MKLPIIRCTTTCGVCGVSAHWESLDLPGAEPICTDYPDGMACQHWLDHDRAVELALTVEGPVKFGPVEATFDQLPD